MTEAIYESAIWEQFLLTSQLTEEAREYFEQIEDDDEPAIRHLIRHFLVPAYHGSSPRAQEHTRRAILWFIYCATSDQALRAADQQGYAWPGGYPEPASLLYRWWWEELFGEDPAKPGDICDTEYKSGYPPDWQNEDSYPDAEVDPDVVMFPRRDGKPPGHGAPTELYDREPPPPPIRPTDAARFFTWQDQAEALDRAEAVHARSGQHKVWVEFQHIVGEGYLVGGQEYRQTNWACVRFRDGLPVDSWPELRRGWVVEQ